MQGIFTVFHYQMTRELKKNDLLPHIHLVSVYCSPLRLRRSLLTEETEHPFKGRRYTCGFLQHSSWRESLDET